MQMFGTIVRTQSKLICNHIKRMIPNGININKIHYWIPQNVINLDNSDEKTNYAVVVLNREILIEPNIVKSYWENAKIRVTVDGGTNQWLSFMKSHYSEEELKYPDYITGDFDSVSSDTLEYFRNSSEQIHTPDQNETDFTKSLKVIEKVAEENKIKYILVLQENSGRLDHIMGNINTLFKAQTFLSNISLYLINSNSLTWLLEPGKHSIEISKKLVEEQRWCSLIPIGNQCNVTTKGLKWNLNDQCSEFGGIVSTSNTYASVIIEIESDGFLLWSMGIFNNSKNN